ncbi:MAG: hypothetical protein R2774_01980 [Saprospiraceae bacterium]
MNDQNYSLNDLIMQIYASRKILLKIIALIFFVSVIGSLLLPNYYKAETMFYAASPDLAKPVPLGGDEKDVRIYGDDNDLDRLFTIANSNDVLFYLIDTFDLYTHYDINKNDQKSKFKVKERLLKNYNTIKTKYGALHLMVEDKDPILASKMANAARERISLMAQSIVKTSQNNLIQSYESNIIIKQAQRDSIAVRLSKLKENSGLYEGWGQSSEYTKILTQSTGDLEEAKGKAEFYSKLKNYRDSVYKYQAEEIGAKNKLEKAKGELNKFVPLLAEVRQLEQELSHIHEQLSLDKERLKQLHASYSSPFTALHIVEVADVPVQKSRPKRSIIVFLSLFIGTVMSIFGLFLIQNMKTVRL